MSFAQLPLPNKHGYLVPDVFRPGSGARTQAHHRHNKGGAGCIDVCGDDKGPGSSPAAACGLGVFAPAQATAVCAFTVSDPALLVEMPATNNPIRDSVDYVCGDFQGESEVLGVKITKTQ